MQASFLIAPASFRDDAGKQKATEFARAEKKLQGGPEAFLQNNYLKLSSDHYFWYLSMHPINVSYTFGSTLLWMLARTSILASTIAR